MNCEQARPMILLADSGELAPKRTGNLDRHLSGCPECRAYRESSQAAVRMVGGVLPDSGPAPAVIAGIRSAAQEAVGEAAWLSFRLPAVRVLAYAAALVALLGGWFALLPAVESDPIGELNALLEVVSSDGIPASHDADRSREEDVRALAEELLSIEGLSMDVYAESDPFTSLEEPPATDPLSRSIGGTLARRCV